MRRRGALRTALLLVGSGALGVLLSCELIVDLDHLDDGRCAADEKACFGECVSKADARTGCAQEQCSPCVLTNAFARCSENGLCVRERCVGDWEDCRGTGTSCETDLAHDPDNCDECGRPCAAPPHGRPGCYDRQCAVGGCDEGFEDCDHAYLNGCEADLRNDAAHCGSCGRACGAGQSCQAGQCV